VFHFYPAVFNIKWHLRTKVQVPADLLPALVPGFLFSIKASLIPNPGRSPGNRQPGRKPGEPSTRAEARGTVNPGGSPGNRQPGRKPGEPAPRAEARDN